MDFPSVCIHRIVSPINAAEYNLHGVPNLFFKVAGVLLDACVQFMELMDDCMKYKCMFQDSPVTSHIGEYGRGLSSSVLFRFVNPMFNHVFLHSRQHHRRGGRVRSFGFLMPEF
jgi:hypothetical protein